ncbi:hypothetical protein C8R43DRAFT_226842 [Mycena crocata]|nr:hypothetical protein C8R43DRAFT_226842 [Mycena crocata]
MYLSRTYTISCLLSRPTVSSLPASVYVSACTYIRTPCMYPHLLSTYYPTRSLCTLPVRTVILFPPCHPVWIA